MTYNRMEAKPIAGEHCRFCGSNSRKVLNPSNHANFPVGFS